MIAECGTRILLVTRNLPPLVGGMERLNWHMAEELAKVAEVRIVGPEGAAALAPAGIDVREVPLKPLWKFLLRARSLARREAEQWKPDIVLAGSGLTAPLALHATRACDARAVVYVHGLDVAVKHPVYRAVWIPALRRMDRVIANSHATAELCRGIGIDASRIGIVHPGVNLPVGGPEGPAVARPVGASAAPTQGLDVPVGGPEDPAVARSVAASAIPAWEVDACVGGPEGPTREFRQHHSLGARPLLLSVGRLSARKGLREFVAQCLPRIVTLHPDAMLLVVGEAPTNALHAEAQTPSSIQSVADAAGIGANIKFLGTITDYRQLGDVYRAADVHVFPVREIPGDPEGFGMVAVEAAAHGLPTVAFATGGVVDAVDEGKSGHLVTPGNYTAFIAAVSQTLSERAMLRETCRAFARRFAWPYFGERVVSELALVLPALVAGQQRS